MRSQAASGDGDQGIALSAAHQAAIRRYFQRRVAPQDVDDLVQDVALSIRQRGSGDAIENVNAYLFTVAAHALSRHRRRAARVRDDDAALATLAAVEDPATPERTLMAREQIAAVSRALDRLPARTREIFMMHRFSAMTYTAIARHFGISASAVEKHMTTALRAVVAATGWI